MHMHAQHAHPRAQGSVNLGDQPNELVINLLSSPGTITDTCSNRDSVEDGRVRSEHPWASQQLAQLAEKKLDDFMMKAHDQAALEGLYVFQYVPWLTAYSYIGSGDHTKSFLEQSYRLLRRGERSLLPLGLVQSHDGAAGKSPATTSSHLTLLFLQASTIASL